MKYIHGVTDLENVPVDILLTEAEFKKAAERALKNPDQIRSCGEGQCWPVDTPKKKCGLLKWVMGRCCECGECE